MKKELEKVYAPKEFEDRIYQFWQENGYFKADPDPKKEPYTIVIPPPNITGVLHMGHALNDTIQDACIRRARMRGFQTRWIIGTDHAGISTQTKVDKRLAEQGISRLEIGREAFVEECYKWRDEYGTTIVNQIKGMGLSLIHIFFSLPGAAGGAFPLVSSSYAVSILGVGALAAVVMTGAGALLSLALPAAGATVTGMMFLKGLVCALGGAVAGWFTISFVVRGQQKADEVAAAMASKTAGAAL